MLTRPKTQNKKNCGQYKNRASGGDNTEQNTEDIPSPRIEIKISGPTAKLTRPSGLEGDGQASSNPLCIECKVISYNKNLLRKIYL